MLNRLAMNKVRFTHLLDRHLEGAATPEEQLELTSLLRMGDPDELGDHFLEIAKARMSISEPQVQSMDEWLRRGNEPIDVSPRVETPAEVFPSQLPFLPRVTATPAPAKPEPEDPTGGAFSLRGNGAAWLKVAAVAIVTLGVSFYYFRRSPETFEDAATALVKPAYTTLSGETYFRLPDGSTILLNAGSSLSYSDSFGVNNRKVVLNGEAYFDVVHDPAHTFTVHSGSVVTSVLGTAFNVKAYSDQNQVIVTVVQGKVRVSDENRTFATITPNQQVIVDMTTHEAEQVIVNTASELAWKEPYVILDNVPVPAALKLVSDKYHIAIRLESEELKRCHITSVFLNNVSLEDVLMIITRSFNANYTNKNGTIVIRGGTCNSSSEAL
jgi:ferric-dicitrate binding protein FerR (iron transport regulator)